MPINKPIKHSQINWKYAFFHLILLSLLCYLLSIYSINYWVFAPIIFFALAYTLQHLLLKDNSKGLRLAKIKDYENAISHFKKCADYLTKNEWIDRHRYITVLNRSKLSYREVVLLNWAFCLAKAGRKQEATELLQGIIGQYPENKLAIYMLKDGRLDKMGF